MTPHDITPPLVWRKLKNRLDRLREFHALQQQPTDKPVPATILEAEVALIEQARDEWRARDAVLCAAVVLLRDALERVANITDGHPVDADRRDRINTIARTVIAATKDVGQ